MRTVIVVAIVVLMALVMPSCGSSSSSDSQQNQLSLPRNLDFAGESVPLDYGYVREAITRELLTTSCMHTATTLSLLRATRYFPVIEPILEAYGLPDDFKYLAVAESSLNENAVSPAKASGLWQFLEKVGREYGLEVNNTVDERYHLEKSTHAACEYLVAAYEKFGSWSLAAASYNAGRSGVAQRLEAQGVDNYWDLFLPEETMRYLPRILSFKILMNDAETYGYNISLSDKLHPFSRYKVIEVSDKKIVWSELAADHGTTYRELRILNPWIRGYEHKNTSRKLYEVKIPKARFQRFGY